MFSLVNCVLFDLKHDGHTAICITQQGCDVRNSCCRRIRVRFSPRPVAAARAA
jgi:hypothetical protein